MERALLQKGGDASDRESVIQRALKDVRGRKHPARTEVGVAAALWEERFGRAALSILNLVPQCQSALPEEWIVTREAEMYD